mgnify:CR=1 FL=1
MGLPFKAKRCPQYCSTWIFDSPVTVWYSIIFSLCIRASTSWKCCVPLLVILPLIPLMIFTFTFR